MLPRVRRVALYRIRGGVEGTLRANPFLLALCASLALALFVVSRWPLPYSPQNPLAQSGHATSPVDPVIKDKVLTARESGDDGTEFWPPIFGYRLKVTDTLLIVFNLLLTVFTGLLWRSTDKLWAASEKQALITKDMLIGDQRAWIVTDLEIGAQGLHITEDHIELDVQLKITNVGRTPAINAHTDIEIVGDLLELPHLVRAFAAELNERDLFNGRFVAAGGSYVRPWYPSASNNALSKDGPQSDVTVIVIGCVTYEILQDQDTHQTAFAYLLGRKRPGAGWGGYPIYLKDKELASGEIEVYTAMGGFAS